MTHIALSNELRRIVEIRHHDPFSVLGKHRRGHEDIVRAHLRGAASVSIVESANEMQRLSDSDLFEWRGPPGTVPQHYRLEWIDNLGVRYLHYDAYCFAAQISDDDLHNLRGGRCVDAFRFLGANPRTVDGVDGVLFATWAPNAERVSVVGDFNRWDGSRLPMRNRGDSGVWELFVPGLPFGTLYKFEILSRSGLTVKTDPYGREFEFRPATASKVVATGLYQWGDHEWMRQRGESDWLHAPLSIYEVHLGSWRRHDDGGFMSYRELAPAVVGYVNDMGFTHIELVPVTEHPLDMSWGYQTTGYFAPTSRFGSPDDFRYFVDYCHRHGVGVILDWVPAHFPRDAHGLVNYDGTALYEHADPRQGEHRDWGTLIFNYGRNEVRSFLISSAVFWLEEFHLDGLRVDAVASMLYLDYSRRPHEWVPNIYGGRENLEAIEFLRTLNEITHARFSGTLMIAEESTAWPQVTRPTWLGGLGFSMKWNMGWMHDTLEYMSMDAIFRHYHHDELTFGLLYAFHENFVLPFSHDEVVHGKGSMINKMPGDRWQQFANLRLLYVYMFTYPGKKLLFMGSEFGHNSEWNCDHSLEWQLLDDPLHQGLQGLVRDLNRLYRHTTSIHRYDFSDEGFDWIDCHDAPQSVLSYLRKDEHGFVLVVLNCTPVPRHGYRLGVPGAGAYLETLNSDSSYYGGSNCGNSGVIRAEEMSWMGHPYSVSITLPPLAALVLSPAAESGLATS